MLDYDPLGVARHYGISAGRLPLWDYTLRNPKEVAERRKINLEGFDRKFYSEMRNKLRAEQQKGKRQGRGPKM